MIKPENRSKIMILIILFALVALLMVYIYYTFFTSTAYVTDAYCDNNGHFNFTIVNSNMHEMRFTYKWHLDDPKANMPRNIPDINGFTNNYYIGSGNITVPGNESVIIEIPLIDDPNYPMMNLVMDIELFDGNKSICHYREQKYDGYWDYTQNKKINGSWDYSTLPPKRR
jgi:hypothetical protein